MIVTLFIQSYQVEEREVGPAVLHKLSKLRQRVSNVDLQAWFIQVHLE